MSRRMMWAALAAAAGVIGLAAPAMAQKTVTVVREIDTDRYDPQQSTSRSGAEVMYMMGDTLVNLDFDMKTLKPGLATSWTVSPDGLTYTFKIRDDVSFCSGKKMTAKDVVATYDRWLDPETKGLVKWRMGEVDKITAPDDVTVEYKLKKPFSELLYQMTQYFHTILNAEQAKQLGADFGVKGFDGTGPFCFESWTPRDSTVLTKHQGYKWGPPIYDGVTEAQVDKVIWKIVRHRPAGGPGRCQPVHPLLGAEGPVGQQDPVGDQGRKLLLDLFHRLQGRQGPCARRAGSQGDEPRG